MDNMNPLEGVRVIELCQWLTGPMTTCIMADQGADVIKVEPPGGDEYRASGTSRGGHGAQFMAGNRNKRSIVLDLKQPDQKKALLELIGHADVFIQNMKLGVVEQLGFGAEALRSRYPRLIYASISGYGSSGPNAHEPAFDTTLQALSGLASIQGDKEPWRPRQFKTILPDKLAGPILSQAISSALFHRERTGKGCLIEYAMLDATIWWMSFDGMMNQMFIGEEGVIKGVDVSEFDGVCKTDDGFLVVMVHQQKAWEEFLKIVNRPELAEDPKLSTAGARMRNLGYLSKALQESFAGKTTEEWCTLLRNVGIACAPVLTVEEMIHYPQVVWNDVIQEFEHPEAGRYRSVRAPVRFNAHANCVLRPSPAAGADTVEVLREFGIELATE